MLLTSETFFPFSIGSLLLMEDLSAIPFLSRSASQLQQATDDKFFSYSSECHLAGEPPHHCYSIRDVNPRWCFGGNRYSYDGFFLGRCGCLETNSGSNVITVGEL